MSDRGAQRKANFFKGTMRDPDAHTTPDAAIDDALIVVGASIDAQAKVDGHDLSTVQRQRALSVAQRLLRALPRDQLQNISAHSGLLKSITDQSLAVAPITDPRAAAQARLDERGQGVGTGDPATALLGRRGLDGMGTSSFARLTELGGATSTEMARTIEQARSEAFRLGMPWAANNPELLRLGAGAIKTLHEAGVQKERFERMTGDKVGFRAATAVEIAAYAKRHNLTPEQTNALYDKINNGVEIISGGNKGVQRELDEATRRYVTGPDSPEARKALEDAYTKHAKTPEAQRAAVEVPKAIVEASRQTQADIAARNADIAARNTKVELADAKIVKTEVAAAANSAGLDDPPVKKTEGQPAAPIAPVATTAAKPPAFK
ncbi:MAG: hypothetical protein ABL904_24255 [Hyphomicrobiaceae bacterium]